ncbi:MAG: hypothetical protein QNL47_08240 [Euryarchaeota archaeon]
MKNEALEAETVLEATTVETKAETTVAADLSETTETTVPTTVAIGIVQSATTTTSLSDKNATDAVKQRAAVADAPTTVVAPMTVDSKAVKIAVDALSETIVPTIVKMAIGTVRNATMTTSLGEPNATSVEHQRLAEAREEMTAVSEDRSKIGAIEETTTTGEAVVEARCTPIMIGSAQNATTQISHSDKNATDAVILVAVAEAGDKAVHHDAMTDEVAIHVEEIHEVADKAVHHDATTDEVAIHEAAKDSEVAANEAAIHEAAIHEAAIHEVATDEVAIHVEEIHEVATDEVAIHVEEIHEVAIHALLAVNLENSVKPAAKKPMVMLTTDRHATLWVEMTDS